MGEEAPIFLMLAPSVIRRQVIAFTLILPEVNMNDEMVERNSGVPWATVLLS